VIAGSEGIVRLLIENGAQVNAHVGHYGNALQHAIVNQEGAIVKLLIENGADVNTQGGRYGNAPQAAIVAGSGDGIIEFLIDIGADVNCKGGEFGNILRAACVHRDEYIVRLLLKNGAEVNGFQILDDLLETAILQGEDAIVKLLMEEGDNIFDTLYTLSDVG
jgi:ankyrin repeat protein